MSNPSFFTAALSSALELGIATADDVVAFATPTLLSQFVPRPLWAKLLTAAIGAPKMSAAHVIETIGLSNIAEHLPAATLWTCLAQVAQRSIEGTVGVPSVKPLVKPIAEVPVSPAPVAEDKPAELVAAPGVEVTATPDQAELDAETKPARDRKKSMSPPPPPPGPNAAAPPPPTERSAAEIEVDSALDALELGDDPGDEIEAPLELPSSSSAGQTSRALAGASSRRPQRRSLQFDAAAVSESDRSPSREFEVAEEQLVEWSSNEETKSGID